MRLQELLDTLDIIWHKLENNEPVTQSDLDSIQIYI